MHPFVSGMGMGNPDTALGLAGLSLREAALDKGLSSKLCKFIGFLSAVKLTADFATEMVIPRHFDKLGIIQADSAP